MPAELAAHSEQTNMIHDSLQHSNEKFFDAAMLIANFGSSPEALRMDVEAVKGVAAKHNCELKLLAREQEESFMSCLPIGKNLAYPKRGLTTSALAVFVPFTTHELYKEQPAFYYGLNCITGNMLMADRRDLDCSNGLILGTPGSGKSFAAKREIFMCALTTNDNIMICDPEGEVRREAERRIAGGGFEACASCRQAG
jgi:type IV secretory pathway VirB4 component